MPSINNSPSYNMSDVDKAIKNAKVMSKVMLNEEAIRLQNEEKAAQERLRIYEEEQRAKIKAAKEAGDDVSDLEASLNLVREKAKEQSAKRQRDIEISITKDTNDRIDKILKNSQKARSGEERIALLDKQKSFNEEKKQQLESIRDVELAEAESNEERLKIYQKYQDQIDDIDKQSDKLEARKKALIEGSAEEEQDRKNRRTLAQRTGDRVTDAEKKLKETEEAKRLALDDLEAAKDSGDEDAIRLAEEQVKKADEANEIAKEQLEEAKNQKELLEDLNKGIQQVMQEATQYMGRLNARLQGTDKTFYSIEKLLDRNLAISPWVKTSDVLNKISQLSDAGIAYNLEQRAFLESIKDNIATTFSAANGTLLRLIRLQQADTTAARLGMEAALTKFFNSQFNDTSYLSNLADSVADALIEAESVRSYDEAMQFEYTVQKWLGSLSSLGVGQNAIQNLAQGLGWIGSGNITQLQSSPMMTLFAMAASEADIDFAKLFTEGMDESDTNKLLRQIVMYLQEVNSGSGNLVVANALANVFGVTVSDLKGIANLTRGDISNIYKSNLSYSGAMSEVQSQLSLSNMVNRVSIQTMMNNIMDNIIHNMGTTIGGSPFAYGAYRGTDILRSMTGGIHLPAFSVFGNMVDLSAFTVEDIIQKGVLGMSALGSLIGAASSLGNGGGLNLSGWGGTQFNRRGGLSTLLTTGIRSGTSMSQYVGSGSGEDVKKQSLTSASEDEDTESISSSKFEDKWDFDKWLEEWDLKSEKAMPVRFTGDSGLPVMIFSGMNDNEIWNSIKLDERTQRGIADKVLEKLGKNIDEKDLKTMLQEVQFKTDNSSLATFATGLRDALGNPELNV